MKMRLSKTTILAMEASNHLSANDTSKSTSSGNFELLHTSEMPMAPQHCASLQSPADVEPSTTCCEKLAASDTSSLGEEEDNSTSLNSFSAQPGGMESFICRKNPGERLQRSRERNRIHARKTRQRKKEQMQVLQSKAEDLKEEQICLKQSINEKNTASILVGLLSKETNTSGNNRIEDPIVEELLCRPAEEIPDASKLPELPALILPGQHKSKKCKSSDEVSVTSTSKQQDLPDDGIDYDLLGKDRSKCTASELDQIRRERNRMHAKRTRDRKRLFMEEMAEMCKRLEDENIILQSHLDNLNGFSSSAAAVVAPNNNNNKPQQDRPFVISPSLSATPSEYVPPLQQETTTTTPAVRAPPAPASTILGKQFEKVPVSEHGVTFDQIKTLLEAAGAFSCSGGASASPVSADNSEGESLSDHDHHDDNSCKRRRLNDTEEPAVVVSSSVSVSVPKSITTSSSAGATPVGC